MSALDWPHSLFFILKKCFKLPLGAELHQSVPYDVGMYAQDQAKGRAGGMALLGTESGKGKTLLVATSHL